MSLKRTPAHRAALARWMRVAQAVLCGMLAALPITQARALPIEKSQVSIAVGGQSAMIYLPLTVAERLGYFKAEGLQVEILDFSAGSKALQAVVGGSADVVAGVYEHTVRMQASGVHLKSFVVLANSMQLALAVSSRQADRIKTPRDLKGMKIGVSAPGSTTHMMVNRILASVDLKPDDVSIIGVGLSGSAISAITSGEIDAICTAEATASFMEQKGLIKVLVDARTRTGTEQVFGGPIPTSVLYAPSKFVNDYPNTSQALANAIIKAGVWLTHATPDEVARLVPESFLGNDRATYIVAFAKVRDGYSSDGLLNANGAADTVSALAAFDPKIKPTEIDVADTFTNQFALKFAAQAH